MQHLQAAVSGLSQNNGSSSCKMHEDSPLEIILLLDIGARNYGVPLGLQFAVMNICLISCIDRHIFSGNVFIILRMLLSSI